MKKRFRVGGTADWVVDVEAESSNEALDIIDDAIRDGKIPEGVRIDHYSASYAQRESE